MGKASMPQAGIDRWRILSDLLPSAMEHGDRRKPANRLLAAVPAEEYERFRGLLEVHPLRMRETLQEAGGRPDYVYFPASGIISALTVLENGMIEFATIGREGTTAVPTFLGVGPSSIAFITQAPGESLRMTTSNFLVAVERSAGLAAIIKRYSGAMLAMAAQSVTCNRAHPVDERCARWLLITHDQAGDGAFPITTDSLVQMLGVSEGSVASSVAVLQDAGLISFQGGEMAIVDRIGLESAACECYAVVRAHFSKPQH